MITKEMEWCNLCQTRTMHDKGICRYCNELGRARRNMMPTPEIVKMGQIERWSNSSRSYEWRQGYSFYKNNSTTQPWMTYTEIRVEAKKLGIKVPRPEDILNEPEKHRCGAYKECAYWAWTEFKSLDSKETMWICTNCSRLYLLDGWTPIEKDGA